MQSPGGAAYPCIRRGPVGGEQALFVFGVIQAVSDGTDYRIVEARVDEAARIFHQAYDGLSKKG